jgi:drug/metabolite transporter (DMT)-like permease
MNRRAVFYALLSAALFGVSTPASKVLLGSIDPTILAGLLYCGAGFGMTIVRGLAGSIADPQASEAPLSRRDLPWLAAAILAGGIVGPVLLMFGLAQTDAATASLLLTLESVVTALMAWFLFRENFGRRIVLGMGCLVAGTAVLSWSEQPTLTGFAGPLAIVAACFAWGLDNNLTRKVSLSDPLQIVQLKGLVAGPVTLALGLWTGGSFPTVSAAVQAAVIGFFCYGVSLAFFVVALRHLGAARTAAYFSTAPFFGVAVAVGFLGEPLTLQLASAGMLMGLGLWMHMTEHHQHRHAHERIGHTHVHVHEEHHHHAHGPDDPPGEPHNHLHGHGRLEHTHTHAPDAHHRHQH